MSKKILLLITSLVLIILGFAVATFFIENAAGSVAGSRSNLITRYRSLNLPDLSSPIIPVDDGCNGLDTNDCFVGVYKLNNQATALNALASALSTKGFSVYRNTDGVSAFNNQTGMYLNIGPGGKGQLDVTVGEASNGPYAPTSD
jgi:hypothetical protein